MGDNLTNWVDRKKNLEVWNILRQVTKLVEGVHTERVQHGKLSPSAVILDLSGENVESINAAPLEDLREWRPAEEKEDEAPSIAGDIFSLGCLFYFVLSKGQHPFGKSGQRAQLIANHLYNLSGCKNSHIRELIAKMISYDCGKRPSCAELLNHPLLWENERVTDYLNKESENSELWTETILLSTKEQPDSTDNEASVVRSVAEILKQIKDKEEDPVKLSRKFPDLLLKIYFSRDNECEKQYSETTCSPETINNILITNESFGEVEPNIPSIKRRHGRFGVNHVHVVQLSCLTDTALMKRIRQLTHPNVLQFFYLTENCSQTYMAFEPFNETLEMWTKRNVKLDYEIMIDILCQITKGLGHYHSNQLIHGNLTMDQVIIFDDGINSITAKVAKFTFDDSSASMLDDVRRLGQIYEDFLNRSEKNEMQMYVIEHLILSMKHKKDEFVPPCDALFYHPLFWDSEEIVDFILLTGEICDEHVEIEDSSMLIESSQTIEILDQLFQHTKSTPNTNRDLIQALSKIINETEMNEPELTEFAMSSVRQFPKSVVLTWLCLQKFKEIECSSDIDSFYHRIYNFPMFGTLDAVGAHKIGNENSVSVGAKEKTSDENFQTALTDAKDIVSVLDSLSSFLEKFIQPQEAIRSYLEQCKSELETTEVQLSQSFSDDDGRTILHWASFSDSFLEYAQFFIHRGASVNAKDKTGLAPLHIATLHNAIRIVTLLIDEDAIIDIPGQQDEKTPLYFAVAIHSIPLVKLLLEKKANGTKVNSFKQTALHIAVAVSNASCLMVEILLNAGIKPNLTDSQGQTALHVLAASGLPTEVRINIVELLIKNAVKTDVADKSGKTALHIATFNEAEDIVSRLLECPNIEVNPKEKCQKMTPLHLAALNNFEKIAKMLIDKKAQFDAEDARRETPLEYAAAANAVGIATLLLNAGAKAKSKRWKLRSPLHIAAAYGSIEVAELLISKDADINAVDEFGFTPLHYAMFRERTDFVKFLTTKQANTQLHSKELCPDDMALIPVLTNGFVKNTVPLNIQLPHIITQYQFKVTITQEEKKIPFSAPSSKKLSVA